MKPLTILLDNNSLEVSQSTIALLNKALLGTSSANKLAAIETLALSKAQKVQIITALGLDGVSKKASVSTTLFGAAQAKVTGIVGGLKTALTALKTVIATHPLLAIGTVLATAVAGVALYQKKMMDDALEAANTGAQAYDELSSSIDEYADRYKALHEELVNANTTEERQHEIKKELLSLQKELNEKYGDEFGKLDLVTQAYKNQTEAILNYKKAAANDFLTDNKLGIKKATDEMTKNRTYNVGSTGYVQHDFAKRIYDIALKYQDQGLGLKEFDDGGGFTGYNIILKADASNADKVLHDFAAEIRLLGKEFEDNSFIETILTNTENRLKENTNIISKYQELYDSALMAQIATDPTGDLTKGYNEATKAVLNYNEALASGNEEDIQKAYEDLNKVKGSIDLASDAWKPYRHIIEGIFSDAATGLLDFQNDLSQSSTEINKLGNEISKIKVNPDTKALDETRKELEEMAKNSDVDLTMRPVIDSAELEKAGWGEQESGIATVYSSSYSNEDGSQTVVVTPILPNGQVLSPQQLEDYANQILNGDQIDVNIKLGMFEGDDSIEQAQKFAEKLHIIQQQYYDINSDANQLALGTQVTRTEALAKIDSAGNDINDPFAQVKKYADQYKISVEDAVDLMVELGMVADDTYDKTNQFETVAPLSKSQVIENINSLSEGFESLDKIMSSMKEKNPFDYALLDDKKFKDNFSGLGDAYTDFVDKISNSPKGIAACQSSFNNLITEWLKGSNALKGLSEETAGVTEAMLTNMGVLNAHEVVTLALANSKVEAIAASYGLIDAEADEAVAFVNTVMASEEAKDAVARYTLQKITANGIALLTNGDIENVRSLVVALDGGVIALDAYNRARQGMMDLMKTSPAYKAALDPTSFNVSKLTLEQAAWERQNLDAINAKSAEYSKSIKEADDSIKAILNNPVSYGGGNKTNKASNPKTKKEKEPTPKDYDWIQRALDAVQRKREALQKQVDDETNSYHDQIVALQELIELDEQFIEVNESALDTYTSRWEQVTEQILNVFGDVEGNALISKIMEGDLSIEGSKDTFTDKQTETLDDAIEIYDNLITAQGDYDNAVEEKTNHLAEQYKKRVAEIEAYIEQLSNELSQAQSALDIKNVTGKQITEADYKRLINLADEEIDKYYDKIAALEDRIAELDDDGSPEYYSLMSAIASCQQAISSAEKSQAEWNEEIKNIPIRKVERYLELLKQIKQDLSNYIDEQNTLGINADKDQYQQLIDISQQQMTKLLEQQKLLKDKLETYQFNTEKYNETASSIQDIDDEISELIRSQYEWNQAILQIPIDSITKTNDILQNAVSAMDEVLSDYDSAIDAVTGTIDKQIDAINDLKDATSDEYKGKIKPLQDELDLLQKQNEARSIQLAQEQAQYDLDRAHSQKINTAIIDGKRVHIEDYDAVRAAQNAKNDADYNKTVHDLQTQISNLEEERDKLLEGYDDQIEKLDEIKDRWSSIVEEIKLAADSLKANDILGTGWQDKILAGNDEDMLNSLKDLYTTISNQKNQYEEQIASNERIADMMNQFMESWQNGSITYDQAMAGIKDLASQMKDGYSSLEHLDAILGVNGVTDLGTLLSQMQNSANASVDQFEDYMKIVKENANALDKYNSSWKEMQQNIRDQIAALEKLAEEATKMANTINKHTSSGGGGSGNKGPNTNDNTYVPNGPGHTDEKLAEAIANGKEILEYHNGGLVENQKSPDRFIGIISSKNLAPNEVYGKLLKNEYVLTEEQQKMLKKNFINTNPVFDQPQAKMKGFSQQNHSVTPNVQITMGNVNLPNVSDVDGFVQDFRQHVEPALRQAFSKVYN